MLAGNRNWCLWQDVYGGQRDNTIKEIACRISCYPENKDGSLKTFLLRRGIFWSAFKIDACLILPKELLDNNVKVGGLGVIN